VTAQAFHLLHARKKSKRLGEFLRRVMWDIANLRLLDLHPVFDRVKGIKAKNHLLSDQFRIE
jgi:hypothetical protein